MAHTVMSETIPSASDRDRTPEHGDVLDHVAHGMGALAVYVVCPCCQRESSQTLNPTASPQDARQESVADMSYAVVSEPTDVGDGEETKTSPPVVLKDVDREQLSKDIALVRRELAKAAELPLGLRSILNADTKGATFISIPPNVPFIFEDDYYQTRS